MGRALLTFGLAALLSACTPQEDAQVPLAGDGAAAQNGHAELTCAACHRGELADGMRAAVPGAACTASGCHAGGGPERVTTATATFPHRDHTAGRDVDLSCAGCHTHDEGSAPLAVSVDACALCHLTDAPAGGPAECRLCHVQPNHVALTSQALPIPHSALPWVETGCVRCHYDVAEPAVRVSVERCTRCHAGDATQLARGVGTDLHPAHVSINCTSCHEGDAHRVRAMSSAVDLVCADCHERAHALDAVAQGIGSRICTDCHRDTHQAQQRLLLGLLPHETPGPSSKFMAGLTCRSCHAGSRGTTPVDSARRGGEDACAGCHPAAYRKVLQWWIDGSRARTALVDRYVSRGVRELRAVASDTVLTLLRDAATFVELVRAGGGQHNLELSDRLFRTSVERVEAAYRSAGRAPPAPPALGNAAHQGTCTFCHYAPTESWDFRRMSGTFHRSVLEHDR